MRLVLSIVQRFSPNKDSTDDIFQVGIIGLIKSIDNFDTSLGVRFSTYAVPMIIGEIRKYLRDSNSIKVTRSTRDIAYKALQAKEKILRETSKEASIKDIAEETGLSESQIADAMNAISEPISLYETVFHDNGDSMLIMDQIKDTSSDEKILEKTVDRSKKICYSVISLIFILWHTYAFLRVKFFLEVYNFSGNFTKLIEKG